MEYLDWHALQDVMPGVSRRTIYRWEAAGDFPRSRKLGPRHTVWLRTEVEAWLATKLAERDAA